MESRGGSPSPFGSQVRCRRVHQTSRAAPEWGSGGWGRADSCKRVRLFRFPLRRARAINERTRVNQQIRISPVRVIDQEGEQIGILPIERGARDRRGAGAGPGGSGADGATAGLPHHGLREVQVRGAAEGARGAEEAAPRADQGSEAAAGHRGSRLRLQAAARATLPRRGEQGEADDDVPGPSDGAPGASAGRCWTGWSRRYRT